MTSAPDLSWSEWHLFKQGLSSQAFPNVPGLYRVRVTDAEVVYIGQTGRNLRQRLGMLSRCYSVEMPYRAPHTAAPTLWALRDRDGVDFEVSVLPLDDEKTERLALEALAITIHRLDHGRSPIANFGGTIDGYRLSSGNSAALVASGKRFRGGRDPAVRASPSSPVRGPIDGEATNTNWIGLDWSAWTPVSDLRSTLGTGVYRIRARGADDLLYIGQGRITQRIRSHIAKSRRADQRQGPLFSQSLEVSWIALNFSTRELLEIENDAIASHRLMRGMAPAAQFLG